MDCVVSEKGLVLGGCWKC